MLANKMNKIMCIKQTPKSDIRNIEQKPSGFRSIAIPITNHHTNQPPIVQIYTEINRLHSDHKSPQKSTTDRSNLHTRSMGRRKIEMKMVKDRGSRQVTFSKRRNGLFKKANDLATLCGLEVAIVVFSPGGKAFSFGNPNVDDVVDRYLNRESEPIPPARESGVLERENENEELVDLTRRLQLEKKKGEMLEKAMKSRGESIEIEDLDLNSLLKLKESLEILRENVKIKERELEASSSLLLLANEPVVKSRWV